MKGLLKERGGQALEAGGGVQSKGVGEKGETGVQRLSFILLRRLIQKRRMEYRCPLCGQPVSPTLYQKITGIWKERQRLLKEIRKKRAKLEEEIRAERERLRKQLQEQATRFKKQQARLIKQALDKQTKQFERRIAALKQREEDVKKRAQERIQKITEQAHAMAERMALARLKSQEKSLRASVRAQLKKEKEAIMQRAEEKYERARRSLTNALNQIEIKDRQLRKANEEINELKRQLRRQTTPQLEGLLYEGTLAEELKRKFREDRVQHTGKGGDVIQIVMRGKERAGVIVYECKRVKHYSKKHVEQAAKAKQKRNADFVVLVTSAMKRGTHGFFMEKGVMVVHPSGVLSLAAVLRDQIIRIAGMKLGQQQREKAVKLILEYLEGPEFANSMDKIIQESISVYEALKDEIRKHINIWKQRYASYRSIYEEASTVKTTSKSLLSGEPKRIKVEPMPAMELLETERGPEIPSEVATPVEKKRVGIAVVELGNESVKEV